MSSQSNVPVYTIEVGNSGTFSNDANVDISATVNSEIDAAPIGEQIDIVFNPGVYGVVTPILLPSNTSVTGNDSTLQPLTNYGWEGNTGLLVNKDAYSENSTDLHVNNVDGSSEVIDDGLNSTVTMDSSSSAAIVDTNISVQGMTFKDTGYWIFGTWFVNATNIDVQNNTYIGGPDGNAFVDVVNGVVAGNIAVGQVNAAYDNWCGPTNITIEDNSTYMSGTSESGWSVLINACPSGNPANPGNATNDGIVGNVFSGYWENGSSGNADPLEGCGFTTESDITQQGNVSSSLNVPGAGSLYTANVISQDIIQDDLFTGTNFGPGDFASLICAVSSSSSLTANGSIIGNLVLGAYDGNPGASLIYNQGVSPTTEDNAILESSAQLQTLISTTSFNGIESTSGNIATSGSSISGSGLVLGIDVSAPPSVSVLEDTLVPIVGISIYDQAKVDVTVTLSTTFGAVSLSASGGATVQYENNGGEEQLILSGSVAQVDLALDDLLYTSNSAGWDDSIKVTASDANGSSATRYVPVLVDQTTATGANELTILPAGYMGTLALPQNSVAAGDSPPPPSLNGEIAIASSGNNIINMGSTISVAFLGLGSDTVLGGGGDEYIATGDGAAVVELTGNGDVTVAGGAGTLDVTVATGSDLVEAGSSACTLNAESGSDTLAAGLGSSIVYGGLGSLYIATLPEDGGSLVAKLGSGNSTILGLSGNCSISTNEKTSNFLVFGVGNNVLLSNGQDTVECGAGSASIEVGPCANDLILGGAGSLVIFGNATTASTIVAGSGNLTDNCSGTLANVFIGVDDGLARTISIAGGLMGITLGTGLSIKSETVTGSVMKMTLSDGTILDIGDVGGAAISDLNGLLVTNPVYLSSDTLFSSNDADASGLPLSIVGSSNGHDTINSGISNTACTTSGSGNVVQLVGGATLVAGGNSDLVAAVGGNNLISITGSGAVIISGGSDTIVVAPSGSLSDAFFAGYSGGDLDFINQSSVAAFIAGSSGSAKGSLTVNGGGAGGYYQGGDGGNNVLVGGTGSGGTTLIGCGNDNFLSVQGSGSNVLCADVPSDPYGGGAATLIAGSGTQNNVFVCGSGTESIVSFGQSVQSFFVGTVGSETITGSMATGATNNYYVNQTASEGGTDVITNFRMNVDHVFINPFDQSDAVSVQAFQDFTASGSAGIVIELSNNTIIKLVGVSSDQATSASIIGSFGF